MFWSAVQNNYVQYTIVLAKYRTDNNNNNNNNNKSQKITRFSFKYLTRRSLPFGGRSPLGLTVNVSRAADFVLFVYQQRWSLQFIIRLLSSLVLNRDTILEIRREQRAFCFVVNSTT